MEAIKHKQSNPFGKECPHCKELLLCENIKMESKAPNPYDHRGKGVGEFTFAYIWFWCTRCCYSEKDIPF